MCVSCFIYGLKYVIYGNLFVSTGKRTVGKRKMEPEAGKGKKVVDNGEIGNVKGNCILY